MSATHGLGASEPDVLPDDALLVPPAPLRPERLSSARLRRMGRRLAGVENLLLRAAVGLGPKGRRP